VNHRWRAEESDQDERFVQELGEKWDVPVVVHRLQSAPEMSGQSWENEARMARKEIFQKEAQIRNALVFTGHQADDLAETVLWRLFTGAASTHGAGIAFQHGVEVRPFLPIRKEMVKTYLQEVGQSYREDSTNQSTRFLRARMRQSLMPEVEKLFPRAIDHLVSLAFNARRQVLTLEEGKSQMLGEVPHEFLLQAAGLKPKRCHIKHIFEKSVAKKEWWGEIHLADGWKLIHEKISDATSRKNSDSTPERWVLERNPN
jgi:tRNA(Ile)-lysidine synthase